MKRRNRDFWAAIEKELIKEDETQQTIYKKNKRASV
jgi:hypothetical protein